ncbi:alkylation response protein AidB-like acyl-CoA dehydrogenase [Streptomyces aurantiacus]|uniref:acyl-CoA dehydrogenase family protein n=1 Tax=Streptomyces aurantiacus TaxID=47760 RepID=UPI002793436A|nr:acyl-CoA dehydrogenase family protein [Streptomyces aurantiacus]MDQ0777933.1 alkylation response protein AidB-like acyl-CoA dehydrogenase [Streptomyces aurantiacus]
MRFLLDDEQTAFARSLDALLTAADTPAAVRSWGAGDPTAGRALWSRIAEAGVFALAVPEAYEGLGPRPVELAVAFVELGRHVVPGPLVETVAAAALLTEPGPAKRFLPGLAAGTTVATVALPGGGPYVLDGDAADLELTVTTPAATATDVGAVAEATAGAAELRAAQAPPPPSPLPSATTSTSATTSASATGETLAPRVRRSLDPARRLCLPRPGGELLGVGPSIGVAAADAVRWARLATAAQALGVGLALLDRTVAYVKQRSQFGVPIGSFQAVRHRLADAKIALEFARPLLFGAALSMDPADLAAAKVAACEAAYGAARTALQLHGAIGYTAEYDLSLWLTKARALRAAWGSPGECRALVLGADDVPGGGARRRS